MYKNAGRTDTQTDRQTDRQIDILLETSISVMSCMKLVATEHKALSGHSENQLMVQQFTRLGNWCRRERNTSPIGLQNGIRAVRYAYETSENFIRGHLFSLSLSLSHTHTHTYHMHTPTPHPHTHTHRVHTHTHLMQMTMWMLLRTLLV